MSAPTFSYAQAAKGRASVPASPAALAADSHTKDDASSVTTAPDASANTSSIPSEGSESAKSSTVDVDLGSKKTGEHGGLESIAAPAKDDMTTTQDIMTKPDSQSANDSSARPSNRSSEPTTDSRKGRKNKKSRNSEKEVENEQAAAAAAAAEAEKEKAKKDLANLVEAAPPSVNIWHKRIEAQAKPTSFSSIIAAESKTKPTLEVTTKTPTNPEAADTQRGPTKSSDVSRPTPDTSGRKPRGGRVTEKGEQTPVPSSAVEDATSWPTPDTVAAEDGKRKMSVEPESKEKQDDGAKASRTKWKKVEITPTVVFNTPLPSRNPTKPRGGAQAGRGSTRGHAGSPSQTNEKVPGATTDMISPKAGGVEPQGRVREDARTALPPSEKSKKYGAEQSSQRKQSVATGARGSGPGDYASKNEISKITPGNEPTAKKDGFNNHSSKKRGGAHANGNGRGAHNGQQSYGPGGNGNGHGSRQPSPPSYGVAYHSHPQQYGGRGGRGSRSGPGPNGFKGAGANGPGRNTQHHQQAGPEFNQFPGYAQAPFPQPAVANPSWMSAEAFANAVLIKQAEYYFSDDNLVKDGYLKSKMDAQGFVPFEIIAGFARMRIESHNNQNAMRFALINAESIEYVLGDGKEMLRRYGDWQKWIVPGSNRPPGPTRIEPIMHPSHPSLVAANYTSPQTNYFVPPAMYAYDPSQSYVPDYAVQDASISYMARQQYTGNGAQTNGHVAADNSPLNVSAPEFSPVPNGNEFIYPQHNWEEQTVKKEHQATSQPSTHSNSGKLPNGTAEVATPAKTNGIHVDSDTAAASEPIPTNGDSTSSDHAANNGANAQLTVGDNLD